MSPLLSAAWLFALALVHADYDEDEAGSIFRYVRLTSSGNGPNDRGRDLIMDSVKKADSWTRNRLNPENIRLSSDMQIVYPVETDDRGQAISTSNRRRRSLSSEKKYFKIAAFGSEYSIELERNNILSPGTLVEFVNNDRIEVRVPRDDCYMIGQVRTGQLEYMAAISTCDGLSGVIETREDVLFIQPLEKTEQNNSMSDDDELASKPHAIYKKSTPLTEVPEFLNDVASNFELLNTTEAPRRSRRSTSYDSHMVLINKSRRRIQIYWKDFGENSNYFETLRPNEFSAVNTYAGTVWLARDEDTQVNLWLNGVFGHTAASTTSEKRQNVFITIPANVEFPARVPVDMSGVPKYIETMVVADSSMTKYHGKENVERYILTLLNVVSRLFLDATLGARLHFVVVRMLILEKDPAPYRIVSGNPQLSLSNACKFATAQQAGTDADKGHFDFAIVLTRNKFGASGYAPVASMCHRRHSCALSEDDGFASSFIVAHECGHVLGLEHDTANNNCLDAASRGSIMAPLVKSRFDRFLWSECSRNELQNNLRNFRCLDDEPEGLKSKYLEELPGTFFSLDEQCELSFSKGAKHCSVLSSDPCRQLWCTIPEHPMSCRTLQAPALDGTTCGEGKRCSLGECTRSTSITATTSAATTSAVPTFLPVPLQGFWAEWSEWTPCSVSCGIGIRKRERECDSSSQGMSGAPCLGDQLQKITCNTEPCEITKIREDRLDEMCSVIGGEGWKMYLDQDFLHLMRLSPANCTFDDGFCSWSNDKEFDKHDWELISGPTPSEGTGPQNDHTTAKTNRLGSYAYFEASDMKNNPRRLGEKARLLSPLILVPRTCLRFSYHMLGTNMGSLRVIVRINHEDRVIWSKTGSQGTQWLDASVSLLSTKQYRVVFEAVRGMHYDSDIAIDDVSLTPGLCPEDRQVVNPCQVSCRSSNGARFLMAVEVVDGTKCYDNGSYDVCFAGTCQRMGCNYQFGSDLKLDSCGVCGGDDSTCNRVEHTENIYPTKELTEILDIPTGVTGFQIEEVVPSPNYLGLRANNVAGNIFNTHGFVHTPGYYTVGETTFVYRIQDGCESVFSQGPVKENVLVMLFSPVSATTVNGSRAPSMIKYSYYQAAGQEEVYRYEMRDWSPCSVSCGTGVQTSSPRCVKLSEDKVVPSKLCHFLPLPENASRPCTMPVCQDTHHWRTLSWSMCSTTCGGGFRNRIIICVTAVDSKLVSNRLCSQPYPPNSESCNTHPCVEYTWFASDWSPCSSKCGRGVQTRTVFCMSKATNETVSDANCSNLEPPVQTQPCELKACEVYSWHIKDSTKCSVSCGIGKQARIVVCINTKDNSTVRSQYCPGPRPPIFFACNTHPCPSTVWDVGAFSECSSTCGIGTRSRQVVCILEESRTRIPDSECPPAAKPAQVEECSTQTCGRYYWRPLSWRVCSKPCGGGRRMRLVICTSESDQQMVNSSLCTDRPPRTTESCNLEPCPSSALLDCNFDNESLCQWTNDAQDAFNWTVASSIIDPTSNRVIVSNSSRGGGFAVAAAIPGLVRGDSAWLVSPLLTVPRGCLSFSYFIPVYMPGRLHVFTLDQRRERSPTVFELRASPGASWTRAHANVTSLDNSQLRIVISATRVMGSSSVVAVDDVIFSTYPCRDVAADSMDSYRRRELPPARIMTRGRNETVCRERSPLCSTFLSKGFCSMDSWRRLCCRTCSLLQKT